MQREQPQQNSYLKNCKANVPSNKSNNDNFSSQSHFIVSASLHKHNSRMTSIDWNKPLFGNKCSSLQELLANANKTTERTTRFINKIKLRRLACANRAKSIPKNATIRKEYIKCGKEVCEYKHGPYCYAYWKDPESKKLKKNTLAIIYI
jgi:hypothetical protein